MSSINKRIVLPIDVKEALYISPITGGKTRIEIGHFVAVFPIHTKKSEHGDYYPASFRIVVVSKIGHQYELENLELIANDQKYNDQWAKSISGFQKLRQEKQQFKEKALKGEFKKKIQ